MTPIILDYPIDFEGGKLTKITLRRAKVADVVSSQKGKAEDAEKEVRLLAALAGLPQSAIEDLDVSDYKKLQTELSGFFG